MGTSYNPKIVTNGLVLNLDAGNGKSYSGAGTNWIDLTKNKFNATIVGPTYSSLNGGGFVFSTNYISLPNQFSFSGQFTFESWVYLTSSVTNNIIYCSQSSNIAGCIALLCNASNAPFLSDYNGATRITTTHQSSLSLNTWNHIVGTRNASNVYIVYLNGIPSITNNSSALSITSQDARLGINPAASSEKWTGNISSFKIYNKSLSAAEVLQNYNAAKGRFGL
jgi:hypothetical protein